MRLFICKKLVVTILSLLLAGNTFSQNSLSTQAQQDLAMLNYVSYVYYDIKEHKNDRFYLEELYSQISDNPLDDKMDRKTQEQLIDLRNAIHKYRMIDIQRNRIEFLYDKQRSQAIKNAIPNPLYLISVVQSGDPIRIAISATATVASSVSSYLSAQDAAELNYLQEGWKLTDDEMNNLHYISQETYRYRGEYVRSKGINSLITLNEKMLEDFAKERNNANLSSKIAFFERDESRKNYQNFGLYYLVLAQAYFEIGRYADCLKAIEDYEKINVQIFRKDYDFAMVLPLAIVAAQNVYDSSEYIKYAEKYANVIKENSDEKDWTLRYLTAQIYIHLARLKDDNLKYLGEAYKLAFDAVRKYANEQKILNEEYLRPIEISKDATNKEKELTKELQKRKEAELHPISAPLLLNCELLFAVKEKLNLPETETKKINSILKDAFVFPKLNAVYVENERTTSKPLDELLRELVDRTNPEVASRSSSFRDAFVREYMTVYKDALVENFSIAEPSEIGDLINSVSKSNNGNVLWNTNNKLVIPFNYIAENSKINVLIISQKKGDLERAVFEDASYKLKINKSKNKSVDDWNCEISFIDNRLNKYKYTTSKSYTVVIDVFIGNIKNSFVFVNKKVRNAKRLIFDVPYLNLIKIVAGEVSFVQVSDDKIFENFLKEKTVSLPTADNYNERLAISEEMDKFLEDYILQTNSTLKTVSKEFLNSFLKEYKQVYYQVIKDTLGMDSDAEILGFFKSAEQSAKIYATVDGSTITLPARVVYNDFSMSIDVVDMSNGIKIFSEKNVPYNKSNKTNDYEYNNETVSMTTVELNSVNFKKIKFDNKKKYRLDLYVSSGGNEYRISFIRLTQKKFFIFTEAPFVSYHQFVSDLIIDVLEKK